MVKATVHDCFENASLRSNVNIWITRPGRGNFLPWARLSFPTAEHKYAYEKFIKEKRNQKAALPGRQKYFSSQRLVPQSFLPTKTEMIKQGKLRLAADWEILVKAQENVSTKKWIASSDANCRHMNVRIQFKTSPRFSVW